MTATILDFVARLASTLAWPIVVTTLAFVFKVQVADILSALQQRIRHLRRATGPGNTSVEFDQVAEEADAAALELRDPADPKLLEDGEAQPPIADYQQRPYFLDETRRNALSVESPAAALLVGYAELENLLRTFYTDTGLGGGSPRGRILSPLHMARDLMTERHLPKGFTDVLRPVAAARNALAHGQVPENQDRAELRDLVEHCTNLASMVLLCSTRYKVDPEARFPDSDSD